MVVCATSYFATYSSEANNALDFFKQNQEIKDSLKRDHSPEDALLAMAIVAPEVSQFRSFTDWAQVRTLCLLYVNFNSSDFSVGYFQMKPSFVEKLECEVENDSLLRQRYSDILIKPQKDESLSASAIRSRRIARITTLEWQIRYLSVFIAIAKQKTTSMNLSTIDKLRYWATLYNSGFHLNGTRVKELQEAKSFPRRGKKFNYSDVAVEFYNKFVEQ